MDRIINFQIIFCYWQIAHCRVPKSWQMMSCDVLSVYTDSIHTQTDPFIRTLDSSKQALVYRDDHTQTPLHWTAVSIYIEHLFNIMSGQSGQMCLIVKSEQNVAHHYPRALYPPVLRWRKADLEEENH